MAKAPNSNVRVLVLRHTKLGESDAILTMLADDGSQLRGIAKGVRKSGSRFGASLEPFTVATIQIYSKRALPMITDARIIESNKKCRDDLDRSTAASVVAATLMNISQEGQEEPRIFDLSAAALAYLGSAELKSTPTLLAAYLFKVLAMHGYRPVLGACASCGKEVSNSDVEHFSPVSGGVTCHSCASSVVTMPISPEKAGWVSFLIGETFEKIATHCTLSPDAKRELLQLAGMWARAQLDVRIKPLDFYLSLT